MSQTVRVSCALSGRSQYLIGRLIHSFQLMGNCEMRRRECVLEFNTHDVQLERLEGCAVWNGKGFIISNKLACYE